MSTSAVLVKRTRALSALEVGDPLPEDFVEEVKELVGFRRHRNMSADSLLNILIPDVRAVLYR